MRIAIVYPPLSYQARYPLLSQNRIFTFTNLEGIKIYLRALFLQQLYFPRMATRPFRRPP